MKTILFISLSEDPTPILFFCALLCVAILFTGRIIRLSREKKLIEDIATIKELCEKEVILHNKIMSDRRYSFNRKNEICSDIADFLEVTTFDFFADPLQTMKDVVTYHNMVIGAELASCKEADGKMYDIIKCVFAQMDRIPCLLPGDDATILAHKVSIKNAMNANLKPS